MAEFEAWPKIPRLNKPYVVTEKLDGTNAAIHIERLVDGPIDNASEEAPRTVRHEGSIWVGRPDGVFAVTAQSRKRLITPESDNFGFAAWTHINAVALVELLGEGCHFGEWWGASIQRGYGRLDKTFSLFNTKRWGYLSNPEVPRVQTVYGTLSVVPNLGMAYDQQEVNAILDSLREHGSFAAPGFMKPEGVVAFHTGSQQLYKAFCEGDDTPKGVTE